MTSGNMTRAFQTPLAAIPDDLRQEFLQLPRSLTVLLENLIVYYTDWGERLDPFRQWIKGDVNQYDTPMQPSRILMQDTAGVAALADLAALRDFVRDLGGDPTTIDSAVPINLVIDHSVAVNFNASPDAASKNLALEYNRNRERYAFFKWAERALSKLSVIPPGNGICHQINLERLSSIIVADGAEPGLLHAETVIGTDSHTTMINALGVFGWGVGGVEAEQVALGESIPVTLPEVINVLLHGERKAGVSATDIALALTSALRKENVVGAFIEYNGPAVQHLTLADRAAISNMCPEYGAACGLFPIDEKTLDYLKATGRSIEQINRIKAHAMQTRIWRDDEHSQRRYNRTIVINMEQIAPVMAGPRRPHDVHKLSAIPESFQRMFPNAVAPVKNECGPGAIAIAAITSCTNTANPDLMIAAGLVARKARQFGLAAQPWVKTSLAPGSRRIANLLEASGLQDDLDALGFHVVGFGCTTCVGNSGELTTSAQRSTSPLCAVISGNRNFENRIHPKISATYLASPPLVVASALAGDIHVDLTSEPLGRSACGKPIYLRDIWPSEGEVAAIYESHGAAFSESKSSNGGDERWASIVNQTGPCFDWDENSTFIRRPPFFHHTQQASASSFSGARALLVLGDDVTTDHISPVGRIEPNTAAAEYLKECGVAQEDWGSFGDRRANHEIMRRGGFAHSAIANKLNSEPDSFARKPADNGASIFDTAMRYIADGAPLIIIAGERYGAGSARDWAAKATALYGVRAILAESFERIHRANLIALGVLPVKMKTKDIAAITSPQTRFSLEGIERLTNTAHKLQIALEEPGNNSRRFEGQADLRSEFELKLYLDGGVFARIARRSQKNLQG